MCYQFISYSPNPSHLLKWLGLDDEKNIELCQL